MPETYSVQQILTALEGRFAKYYFTPKKVTLTVASSTVGHIFVTNFGNVLVSYTAVSGDTTSTIATSIANKLKLYWQNSNIGSLLIDAAADLGFGAIITITGGAYEYDTPTTTGSTGTYTAAISQAHANRIFKRVRVIPEMDEADLGRLTDDEPFALITDDGSQLDSENPGFELTTIHVIIGTRIRLQQWNDESYRGTGGALHIAGLVAADLARNRSFLGTGAKDPIIWFVATRASSARAHEKHGGVVTKQITFACLHKSMLPSSP